MSGKIERKQLGPLLNGELDGIVSASNQNEIINGNFDHWQRGVSATNMTVNTYLVDRFIFAGGLSGTIPTSIIHSRCEIPPGEIPKSKYGYRINFDGTGTMNPDDIYTLQQLIENGTSRLCGLNKKVTISFWARSSIPNKKLGIYLVKNYGTGGSPSPTEVVNGSYIILTSSWSKYSITIDTNTIVGKTFGTNNNDYIRLVFSYFYGSNVISRFGDTVAESFGGAGTIDIAQVKLEAGDKATPFVPRPIGEELALCQRYYVSEDVSFKYSYANAIRGEVTFHTRMRVIPTITYISYGTTPINIVEGFSVNGFSFGNTNANTYALLKSYTADSEIY